MILIADSGSTKTTWGIISGDGKTDRCRTSGINPFMQTTDEISFCLQHEFTISKGYFDTVYFYGAGCADRERNLKVKTALKTVFDSETILVDSDLMAAARSLCGSNPGIAAIIGTGSNSCYYDGSQIKRHVPPLGYILGDEGSGTVIGRKITCPISLKISLPLKL
jgi:N-acetylglucosamine kinase-like BadF-type ATPase